jgi:uncharacterized membrane protein YcaP (DUF421 family)
MAAVFRAIFGYCFLILMVRIAGRRPGKQITPFEFVLIFFMGGVTLTAMVGDDRSLTNALIQIATIGLTHFALIHAKLRWPAFGRIVDGTPLVILEKGQWKLEAMKGMRLQEEDIMAMARDQGLKTLRDVDYAILERNGEIVVIPAEKKQDR